MAKGRLRGERQLLSPPVHIQTRKKPRVSVSKRAGLQVFIVATHKIADTVSLRSCEMCLEPKKPRKMRVAPTAAIYTTAVLEYLVV